MYRAVVENGAGGGLTALAGLCAKSTGASSWAGKSTCALMNAGDRRRSSDGSRDSKYRRPHCF